MANKRQEWKRIEIGIFDFEILRILDSDVHHRIKYGFFSGMAKLIESRSKMQCHKRYENQIKQKGLSFQEYSIRKFKEHHFKKKYFELIFEQYKARLKKHFEDDEAEIITRCDQIVSQFSKIMGKIDRQVPVQDVNGPQVNGSSEYSRKSPLKPIKQTSAISNESAEQNMNGLDNGGKEIQAQVDQEFELFFM